jgi:hypothetical protein
MSFINWGNESPEQLRLRKRLEEQMLLEQAMYSAATAAAAAGSGGLKKAPTVYYLRAFDSSGDDANTEPWDGVTNINELNTVFGENGWSLNYFESVDPTKVFVEETTYVFIDGSDRGADELAGFLSSYHDLIEDWVIRGGGKLFLNSAPNEGGNIDFYFGGTVLVYDGNSDDAVIAPSAIGHPIFSGPGNCGTEFTGDSFAHATLTGDSDPLIINPGIEVLCAELSFESGGKVIFGGMTITEFHDPQPEAAYLRMNIHSYLSGKSYIPQLGMRRSMASSGEFRRSSKG